MAVLVDLFPEVYRAVQSFAVSVFTTSDDATIKAAIGEIQKEQAFNKSACIQSHITTIDAVCRIAFNNATTEKIRGIVELILRKGTANIQEPC